MGIEDIYGDTPSQRTENSTVVDVARPKKATSDVNHEIAKSNCLPSQIAKKATIKYVRIH